VIETSTDAWFESLDAATTTNIRAPFVQCNFPSASSASCGCGSSDEEAGGLEAPRDDNGVTVLHEGTVGPYETVTLASTQPGALNTWLTDHGYNVDAETQPLVDAYSNAGFDFIALRLQPGQGVRQMKPVRVLSPGMSAVLPLRMVAAGTGAEVAITLFTITESRFAAENFANAEVPRAELVWDFNTQSSNYSALRQTALSASGGEVWLTTYAAHGSLLSPTFSKVLGGPAQYTVGDSGLTVDTIAWAYLEQGIKNDEAEVSSCGSAIDELEAIADSGDVVVNPCPFGAKPDDPACTDVAAGEIDSRALACGALDDIAVALRGLHPKDVWLTRLEANLPRAALGRDLNLQPAPADKQLPLDNWIQVQKSTGDPCGTGSGSVAILGSGRPRRGPYGGLVLLALAALALVRRAAGVLRAPSRGLGAGRAY
jgi:hypothetical protein